MCIYIYDATRPYFITYGCLLTASAGSICLDTVFSSKLLERRSRQRSFRFRKYFSLFRGRRSGRDCCSPSENVQRRSIVQFLGVRVTESNSRNVNRPACLFLHPTPNHTVVQRKIRVRARARFPTFASDVARTGPCKFVRRRRRCRQGLSAVG